MKAPKTCAYCQHYRVVSSSEGHGSCFKSGNSISALDSCDQYEILESAKGVEYSETTGARLTFPPAKS